MPKSRRLNAVVYVDGVPYGPGKVPANIADQITNPNVWADESADEAPPATPPANELPSVWTSEDDEEPADQAPADDEAPAAPPAFDIEHATKPELEAEIARRNEGRAEADLIVVAAPGNKPELQAALAADNA